MSLSGSGAERPPGVQRAGVYTFAALAVGMVTADALPAGATAAMVWLGLLCLVLAVAAARLHLRSARRAAGGEAVGGEAAGGEAGAQRIGSPQRVGWGGWVLLLGAGLLGGGVYAWRLQTPDAGHWWVAGAGQGGVVTLRGRVEQGPRTVEVSDQWERPPFDGAPVVLSLRVQRVLAAGGWRSAGGQVVVLVRGGRVAARAGDEVETTGRLEPLGGSRNPGEQGAERWARQQGRVGQVVLPSPQALVLVPSQAGAAAPLQRALGAWQRTVSVVRAAALGALERAAGQGGEGGREGGGAQGQLGADHGGGALLKAMILGVEEPSLRPVYADMSRTGIVHLLSISGFHLVLVAWVVVGLIRLTGDWGVWEYLLAAAAIGLYLVAVPAEAPVVRSGVMVLALLAAEASGRRYDRLNVLAWTACLLALWRPADLFAPGFQLSFGVTAALLWRGRAWVEAALASGWLGMPGIKGRTRADEAGRPRWWLVKGVELVSSTLLAWLVSVPVVAWHTGLLTLAGLPAGIVLTVPSILAIGAGFVAMLIGLVWPAAAEPVGHVARWLSQLVVDGSSLAADLPGSAVTLPSLPLVWVAVATGVVIAAIRPGGWGLWTQVCAGATVAALAAVLWLHGEPDRPVIDRLSIEGSSAMLIRSGREAVMIDPGSKEGRAGVWRLSKAARGAGAWRIHTVVITGPQPERFNHLPELARTWGVARVVLPPEMVALARSRPMGDAARLLRSLHGQGVEVATPLPPGPWARAGEVEIAVSAPGAVVISSPHTQPTLWLLEPVPAAERTVISTDGLTRARWEGRRYVPVPGPPGYAR